MKIERAIIHNAVEELDSETTYQFRLALGLRGGKRRGRYYEMAPRNPFVLAALHLGGPTAAIQAALSWVAPESGT